MTHARNSLLTLTITLCGALIATCAMGGGGASEERPYEKQKTPVIDRQAGAENCIGKGFFDVDPHGRRSVSPKPLACAGLCNKPGEPEVRCSEQTNAAKDRRWCGCPGEGEPTLCHIVKVKVKKAWTLACDDPCPIPTDVCTPSFRTIADPEVPNGKRIVMSCDCLAPPLENAEKEKDSNRY